VSIDIAQDLTLLVSGHIVLLLFINVLLDQGGLPVPSYPALVVAGTLVQQGGDISLPQAVAAAVLACLIADTLWYCAGRRYGALLMRGVCRVSLSPDTCIRKSNNLYRKVGPRLLMIAKFLPGAGALTTLMAGTTRTRLLTFWLYDIAGSVIWASSALILGMLFKDAVGAMLELLAAYVLPSALALLALFLVFLGLKWGMRTRVIRRSRRIPRLQAQALYELRMEGKIHTVVDVRPEEEDEDSFIPGAIRMELNARKKVLDSLPSEGPVIVYCDCPDEVSASYLAERIRETGRKDVFALQGGIRAWREIQEKSEND
jgi:membrane protein DedA with SNARE-associated domain/rhodanese-related sulfurtransferase